ncbi:MAG: hypothetical protein GWM90_24260, partial [Gemmatimonadetes bacterium]|nr:hypothetical protein [Gemmatimonadota bacterium]NIQ57861.1 hypothetical protein [Gemmatimonadota bacterium]NIU78017.1 hypothetical protein [Gammaproteobacteria bacterium]NIX47078.1 hypothetical protein [Gemmatimonadota bacterium]NIY11461.1 hypothetical protein [Gemmatimonadota bacterium]
MVRSVDWTLCLKPGSSPHRAELLLREKLGGSLPIQLLVAGDLLDPATLRVLRAMERRMDALPSVSGSLSLASLLAEMNEAVNGRYAVPATREGAANLWFLIENEEALEQIVAAGDVRQGLVQGRVADWETPSIREAVDGMDAWSASAGSAWAVVDPRQARAARAVIEGHRARDLVTQLLLEFRARDVSPPPGLNEVVSRFVDWTPGSEARARVADAVFRYVTGPDAEVPLEPATARRLADRMASATGVWGADASTGASVIRAVAPTVADEDAAALALSLRYVTYDAAGSHRVARAMAQVTGAAPVLARSTALRRNLEGAFWEAHDPMVVAPEPVVATWALGDSAIVRLVPVDVHRSGLASVLDQM